MIKKQCTERKTSIALEYPLPRLKIILGTFMIVLGILLAIITYNLGRCPPPLGGGIVEKRQSDITYKIKGGE